MTTFNFGGVRLRREDLELLLDALERALEQEAIEDEERALWLLERLSHWLAEGC